MSMNDSCISCGVELEEVFPPSPCQQYENALAITLSGGYGMFFDNIHALLAGHDGDYHIFLCHDCAHDACDKLSWLKALLQPESSHSHRYSYWVAHRDHEGWDTEENRAEHESAWRRADTERAKRVQTAFDRVVEQHGEALDRLKDM